MLNPVLLDQKLITCINMIEMMILNDCVFQIHIHWSENKYVLRFRWYLFELFVKFDIYGLVFWCHVLSHDLD